MADFSTTTVGSQTNQQLFIRKCKLVVSNTAGNGIDLSNLRVKFRVQAMTVNTLKNAEITVYNLSPDTAKAIFSTTPSNSPNNQFPTAEFNQVSLWAGYQTGPFAQIFQGNIVYMRLGREDALTNYLTLVASDGDQGYNWGILNKSLPTPSEATPADQFAAIVTALQPYNIGAGYTPFASGYQGPAIVTKPLSRGKVLYDSLPNILNQFASSLGCIWNIQDGLLNIYPSNSPPPVQGDVITLTPQTGLVGVPEQTLDGLTVRCLLHPSIKTGSYVQVPTQYITQGVVTGPQPNPADLSLSKLPNISTNQLYQVYALAQVGDTRGKGADWCAELICIPTDKNRRLPISNTYLNAVPQS